MTPQQRLAQLAWEGAVEKFGCKTGNASFETIASRSPQDEDLFGWHERTVILRNAHRARPKDAALRIR